MPFTTNQLNTALQIFDYRMQAVNSFYLRKIGEDVKKIKNGSLSGLTSVDKMRVEAFRALGANMYEIKKAIEEATSIAFEDITNVFMAEFKNDQDFYKHTYGELGNFDINDVNNYMRKVLEAQLTRTKESMFNLARTTVLSTNYRAVVDSAITEIVSGVGDYGTAMRNAMRRAATEGLQVQYQSGLKRRLDSAMRMNILEGVSTLSMEISKGIGKMVGCDAYEISVVGTCAPDHIDIQGLVFDVKTFEEINAGLKRPIGTLNCRHIIFPTLLSSAAIQNYSNEELYKMKAEQSKLININGKSKTKYEWSQVQRKLETSVRREKDVWNVANAAGDETLKRDTKARIKAIQGQYEQVSKAAGLPVKKERMSVSGYLNHKSKTPPEMFKKLLNSPKYTKEMFKEVIPRTVEQIKQKGAKYKTIDELFKDSKTPQEAFDNLNGFLGKGKVTAADLKDSGFYTQYGVNYNISDYYLQQIADGKTNFDSVIEKLKKKEQNATVKAEKATKKAAKKSATSGANDLFNMDEFDGEDFKMEFFKKGYSTLDKSSPLSRAKNETQLREHHRFFENNKNILSRDQMEGLQTYTGSAYSSMNTLMRTGSLKYGDAKRYEDLIKVTESCFNVDSLSVLKEDAYLVRGFPKHTLDRLFQEQTDVSNYVGKAYTDKAFMSASFDERVARDFGGNEVLLYVKAPKGAKGIYVDSISRNSGEYEMLMNPNSSVLIQAAEKDSHGTIRLFGTLVI